MASFLLVHSPLVGPATWSWVAAELRRHGHDAAVPSLLDAATSGRWEDCVDAAVAAAPTGKRLAVAGHSAAGSLLPAIAGRLDPNPSLLVFVDSVLPPPRGEALLVPEQFRDALSALARDGVLPPWDEWFEPGTMERLVPDAGRRDVVRRELPSVPLSCFGRPVPVPAGWTGTPCGYVLLSELYRNEAVEARSRGWPVVELLGAHLDLVARPAEVAAALATLAGDGPPTV